MAETGLETLFSSRARKVQASAIREICKLVDRPDLVSLAGGWPSPETFPTNEIKEIVTRLLDEKPDLVLQYGTSEGLPALRRKIADWLSKVDGITCSMDQVVITTGSTQGIELAAKVFIDEGDAAFVGLPSYFGGVGACQTFGAELFGIALDSRGMVPDLLEDAVQIAEAKGYRPKLLYVIPDFQNPSGTTLPLERRRQILDIASRHDMVVVEDTPYRDLWYDREPPPTLYSLDKDGRVVFLRSFSKNFCPGFRLSLAVGHEQVIRKMVVARQFEDACPNVLGQHVLLEFLESNGIEKRIRANREFYRAKRDKLLQLLEQHFPEQVSWNRPMGGFFVLVRLPEGISGMSLLNQAVQRNVAFVAGQPFHVDAAGDDTFRLSFSQVSDESMEQAVKVLGELLQDMLDV